MDPKIATIVNSKVARVTGKDNHADTVNRQNSVLVVTINIYEICFHF